MKEQLKMARDSILQSMTGQTSPLGIRGFSWRKEKGKWLEDLHALTLTVSTDRAP